MENKGITLIALVVTIIILVIISGISISLTIGNNGIVTKSKLAKQMTQISNEKEAIQLNMVLANMNEDEKYNIGTPLYDKNLENGNMWHIIINNENQDVYGTGWYIISNGTEIPNYGRTQLEWIVNYEQQNIKQLDYNYTELSYKDGLAITDGLVFNVDPLNMQDENSWGENIKLYGFDDEDETGGYKDNTLIFDGKNDYITIDGNLNVKNEITLEFYGKINNYYSEEKYKYVPLFSAYSETKQSNVDGQGMRLFQNSMGIMNNYGYVSCGNENIWENSTTGTHNLAVSNKLNLNEDFAYTSTYDHNTCIYTVYINGSVVKREKLDSNYWENFKKNEIPNIKYFQIGKTRWNSITGFFNGKMYAVRIYNKCLSEKDIKENYNKTIACHNLNY